MINLKNIHIKKGTQWFGESCTKIKKYVTRRDQHKVILAINPQIMKALECNGWRRFESDRPERWAIRPRRRNGADLHQEYTHIFVIINQRLSVHGAYHPLVAFTLNSVRSWRNTLACPHNRRDNKARCKQKSPRYTGDNKRWTIEGSRKKKSASHYVKIPRYIWTLKQHSNNKHLIFFFFLSLVQQ